MAGKGGKQAVPGCNGTAFPTNAAWCNGSIQGL